MCCLVDTFRLSPLCQIIMVGLYSLCFFIQCESISPFVPPQSNPQSLYMQEALNQLLPSHTYGVVSGGDPAHITSLTHKQLKDFHAKHYHPSNARFSCPLLEMSHVLKTNLSSSPFVTPPPILLIGNQFALAFDFVGFRFFIIGELLPREPICNLVCLAISAKSGSLPMCVCIVG